jgi:hypothetical protein
MMIMMMMMMTTTTTTMMMINFHTRKWTKKESDHLLIGITLPQEMLF